ncbi:hypothetical protein [Sphingobacterium sp. LRF_L2]|uniref:hypothetical protein n=1 Tax=Sphingobacterium sp. LRF_L2 TaxID=3369421 RepID=UPI003F5FEFEB
MIIPQIIFWILILSTFIAITFGLFSRFNKRFIFTNKNNPIKEHKPNMLITMLLVIAILLIFFAFYAPVLFTNSYSYSNFDSATGVIGDTIGGIMDSWRYRWLWG